MDWQSLHNVDPFSNRSEVFLNPATDIDPYQRWWAPVELIKNGLHAACTTFPLGAHYTSQLPLNKIVEMPRFYYIYTRVPQFLYAVCFTAVVWAIMDQLLKRILLPGLFGRTYMVLDRSDAVKWDNYCLSTLHATIVSLVGVYLSIPTFPWHIFNATLLFHSTHELGLLKYDKERNYLHMFFVVSYVFLWHLMDWSIKGSAGMLAHHILSLATIIGCSCSTPFVGGVLIANFYVFEITTPFLHFRWFLWKLGRETTKLYVVNGLILIAMFFVFRVLLGTILLKAVISEHVGYIRTLPVAPPLLSVYYSLVVMAVVLCCMQYYWFILLVGKGVEIFRKSIGKKSKKR